MSIAEQLGDLPIAGMITSLAQGIAQAQLTLDQHSMVIAQLMSGVDEDDRVQLGSRSYSLLELGLTPTFYHFTESVLEVKMAISMTTEATAGGGAGFKAGGVAVDASYSNKYQYSVEGSSRVQTRLVATPPPAIFQERVRMLAEEEARYRTAVAEEAQ